MKLNVPTERLLSRLKLRHFVLLRALATTSNVSSAANELHISQPAASTLLREIEDAVGVKLFERLRHGITPNQYGKALIRWALVILSDVYSARDDLEAISTGALVKIRLGISPATAQVLIPRAIVTLRERFPSVLISIQTGIDSTLIPALRAAQFDFVVTRLVPEALAGLLTYSILYEDRTVVVVGAKHPLCNQLRTLKSSDLEVYKWILPSTQSHAYEMVTRKLVLDGSKLPIVAVETWSVMVIAHLLPISDLLAIMPYSAAKPFVESGQLTILPVNLSDDIYPIIVVGRKGTIDQSPAHEAFIEILNQTSIRYCKH